MAPVQVVKSVEQDGASVRRSLDLLNKLTNEAPGSAGNGPTLVSAIQKVEKAFKAMSKAQQKDQAMMEEMGAALRAVVQVDGTKCEAAVKEACSFMTYFARIWAFQGAIWAASVMPALAQKHGSHSEAMTSWVTTTMCALVSHCWDEDGHLLLAVLNLMEDGQVKPSTLRHYYDLVKIMIEKWPPSAIEEHRESLGQRFALDMKSEDIARASTSQQHFAILARKWPDVGTKVFKSLPKDVQDEVLKRHPLMQTQLNIKRTHRKAAGSTPSPAGSVGSTGKTLPVHPHKLGLGPAEYQQQRLVKEGSQLDKLVQWKKRKDLLAADAIQDIVGDSGSISTENSFSSLGKGRSAEALALSAKKHEELKKRKLNMMSPTLRHHLTADAKGINIRTPTADAKDEAKGIMDLPAAALANDDMIFMSPAEAKSTTIHMPCDEAKREQAIPAGRDSMDVKAAAEVPAPCAFDAYEVMEEGTLPSEGPPESKSIQDMTPDDLALHRHVSFSKTPTIIRESQEAPDSATEVDSLSQEVVPAATSVVPPHKPMDFEPIQGQPPQEDEGEGDNFELAGLRALDNYELGHEEELPLMNLTQLMADEGEETKINTEQEVVAERDSGEKRDQATEPEVVGGLPRRWIVGALLGLSALVAMTAVTTEGGNPRELMTMLWSPNINNDIDAEELALIPAHRTAVKAPEVPKDDDKRKKKNVEKHASSTVTKVNQAISQAPTPTWSSLLMGRGDHRQKEPKLTLPKISIISSGGSKVDMGVHRQVPKQQEDKAAGTCKGAGSGGVDSVPPAGTPPPPPPSTTTASASQVKPLGPSFGRRILDVTHRVFTKKNALLGLAVMAIMILFGMP